MRYHIPIPKVPLDAMAGGTADYSNTGSGGIVFAGDAVGTFGLLASVSGGIAFSGEASQAFGLSTTPSGGIVFSGSATTEEQYFYSDTPSGGITFSGAASGEFGLSTTATGGIEFSGSATTVYGLSYTPTGGITLGGEAGSAYGIENVGAGGITFGGAAAEAATFAFVDVGSGGLTLNGTAPSDATYDEDIEPPAQQSGGGSISYYPPLPVAHYRFLASGGIGFSGFARTAETARFTNAGDAQVGFSGTADHLFETAYIGAGVIRFSARSVSEWKRSKRKHDEDILLTLIGHQ